jgi:hypothetical protein
MAQAAGSATVKWAVILARIVGFLIFVAAFFQPAVREVASGSDAPDVLQGSRCAWITLVNSFSHELWHSRNFLAILSGWINPLLVLYLIFLAFPNFKWPRRIVAGLIVLFIVGTWVFFYIYPLVPLVGHFLWIAGVLLILAGELRRPAAGN